MERSPPQDMTPHLNAARAEGYRAGVDAELARIQAIEAQMLPGHEELINRLKFDGVTTAAEAAVRVLQAEREKFASIAADLAADTPAALPFVAHNELSEPVSAPAMTAYELATAIAQKQAEASANGQTLSSSAALAMIKKES